MVQVLLDRVPVLFDWDEDRIARWERSDNRPFDSRRGSGDHDASRGSGDLAASQSRNDQNRVLSRMGLESDDDNLSSHSSWSTDTMASVTNTLSSTGDEDSSLDCQCSSSDR